MTTTIGVAITIPPPHDRHLADIRGQVGDPLACAIPPHVTLLPPTPLPAPVLAEFVEHLEAVAASVGRFLMVLRGAASFRPVSPVVFVQVSEGISSCEQLERAVRSGPVDRPLEFNYHPHVTVAHHVPDPALDEAASLAADFHCAFEVGQFDLYEQGDDQVWRPQRQFTLTGGDVRGRPVTSPNAAVAAPWRH